jgi:hypothetical protein
MLSSATAHSRLEPKPSTHRTTTTELRFSFASSILQALNVQLTFPVICFILKSEDCRRYRGRTVDYRQKRGSVRADPRDAWRNEPPCQSEDWRRSSKEKPTASSGQGRDSPVLHPPCRFAASAGSQLRRRHRPTVPAGPSVVRYGASQQAAERVRFCSGFEGRGFQPRRNCRRINAALATEERNQRKTFSAAS